MSENELWFELVDGFYKGGVYGTGTARELYYDQPNTRTPSSQQQSYVPGIYSQFQGTLEAERQQWKAQMEAREAARDEEMRKMKEQMALMTSYFSSCNPGWRPPTQDPRDPSGGGDGGGGATSSFPVY